MNIEEAYEYFLNRGMVCFPVAGKKPTVWLKDRTESIMPRAGQNLGVMTKGLVVVDIDSPEAATPSDFPCTFTVQTGRGWHLYFLADPHRRVSSCKLGGNTLIDVKAHPNHYVVGPGSLHASGKRYEYLGGVLTPVPCSVLDLRKPLGADSPVHGRIVGIREQTREVMRPEANRLVENFRRCGLVGNRDNALFVAFVRFFEGAARDFYGLDTLAEIVELAVTRGLTRNEIDRCMRSAEQRAWV